MNKNAECKMISPFLDAHIKNHLKSEDANQVEKHLSACPGCRSTIKALKLVLQIQESPGHRLDLLPILRYRLAESEEVNHVNLTFPSFNWQTALALSVVILSLLAVPGHWRLLIAIGIF